MDEFVTFFGYIQNVVLPSRRNRNTNGTNSRGTRAYNQAPDESPKTGGNFREGSLDSGFNSTNGGLKGVSSGETNLNWPRASLFTETNLDTLRGEVRDIKPPPTRCKNLIN